MDDLQVGCTVNLFADILLRSTMSLVVPEAGTQFQVGFSSNGNLNGSNWIIIAHSSST